MKALAAFWLRFLMLAVFVTIAGFVFVRGQSPSIKVVNLIPASLSGETNQDSEPFLAMQALNPQTMVASGFTPHPFSASGNAPVYISEDGGNTWVLSAITPEQRMTCDITHAMPTGENHPRGDLHAGTLACAASITLDESESNDVSASAVMNVQSTRTNVDQPFVRALGISNSDRIYVGLNDFNQPSGHTATLDISVDGGATYKSVPIEKRKTSGQDGPSVRPAVAPDNTVYAAFFGWRKFNGSVATSDVVVVRDDAGAAGPQAFQALKDPSDKLPGRVVVKRVSIPWSNAPTLGQERIGSTLSIAVDPNNSSTVYVGWADRGRKGDIYTLHVRRSTDRGVTWSKSDLPHTTIANATNIALAVANNGVAGLLYQQLSGGRWVTHVVQSRDGFATIQDTVLAGILWMSLLSPAALPQATDNQAAQLKQSSIIFAGTVSRVAATSFAGVPKSARTIVVRVDSVLKKPATVSLKSGDSVTVEVKD